MHRLICPVLMALFLATAPAALRLSDVAVAQGAVSDATWKDYIKARKRADAPKTAITLDKAQQICLTAAQNGMQMQAILSFHGLPNNWKHNRGSIEAAWWPIASNKVGIKSLSIFYTRNGKIRNVAYFGHGANHLGGISKWMTPQQICVPGARHPNRS